MAASSESRSRQVTQYALVIPPSICQDVEKFKVYTEYRVSGAARLYCTDCCCYIAYRRHRVRILGLVDEGPNFSSVNKKDSGVATCDASHPSVQVGLVKPPAP